MKRLKLNQNFTQKKAGIQLLFFPLVFLMMLFSCHNNSGKTPGTPTDDTTTTPKDTIPPTTQKIDSAVVTVAGIFPDIDKASVQITFDERQMPYALLRNSKNFDTQLRLLEEALKSRTPVKLIGDVRGGISTILPPTSIELEVYKKLHINDIRDLVKPRIIDVNKIDTSLFNRVEILKWPAFLLCRNIIPSYAKAKEIFDSCAQQSCHLGIPTSVTPCIPFQYVRDGCFARAHKMRYIIESRFRYCSEKVFSYGVNNAGTLAVRANKWGGCCVGWWYHVAPLVRVRVNYRKFTFTLAYVIDPSMFDSPVLLSTWLQAQANTTCNANAGVGSYSIQPSSVYTPGGATDPTYSMTNSDLAYYNFPGTCP